MSVSPSATPIAGGVYVLPRRTLAMRSVDKLLVGSFATFFVIGCFVDWINGQTTEESETHTRRRGCAAYEWEDRLRLGVLRPCVN